MAQVIADRYEIQEKIGAGGMGIVYRGVHLPSSEPVAIKELNASTYQPNELERFRREGEALRDLNHPNIIKFLEAIQEDNRHYLIMEYVPGGDLHRLIQQGALPVPRILTLAIDLSDALTRAHKLNIIHRDLKPANVLLDKDGTLRLTDFGIAYMTTRQNLTASDVILGTLHYMSPEALNGEKVDTRTDIWSFGVMLFEMLTGQQPFQSDDMVSTILNIMNGALPDLEILRPDAPAALIDLVYRMLSRDPRERIASVRLVGAELEALAHGRNLSPEHQSRFDTPTPVAIIRPRHNLPVQITPFVGRESELIELDTLLVNSTVRLITIVAPGGMGKTRLSLAAAEHQLGHFQNGVYLVELAPLTEVDSLLPAIADAVGYQFQRGEQDIRRQLLDFFREKQMLLVLDNFEHLIEGAGIVVDILQAAPGVCVLATSRRRLNIPGETLFHLSGMDFPTWETPADALNYAAMQLFLNSARRAQPSFELTAENLDDVARICRLVEGMPLGIVLAAAWLAILSPEEIAAEIQQSLDFLEAQAGEGSQRQQSIRAVMDYAWHMLDTEEQQVFMKLSVFRGGFTRPAAQSITGASLRLLMTLVTKSLLRRDNTSGRYHIHELLRQYASQKLEEAGITASVEDDHSAYYLKALHQRHSEFEGPNGIAFLNEIHEDYENVSRAALWAAQQGELQRLDQALYTHFLYHLYRAEFKTAESLFRQLLNLMKPLTGIAGYRRFLSHLLVWNAHTSSWVDQLTSAKRLLDEARNYMDSETDPLVRGYLLLLEGRLYERRGASRPARPLYEQALALFRQAQDNLAEDHALSAIASTYWGSPDEASDWQQVKARYEEIYTRQKQRGDTLEIVVSLNGIGVATTNLEKSARAGLKWLEEGLAYAERWGNLELIADFTLSLGVMRVYSGKLEEAIALYEKCIAFQRERGDIGSVIFATGNLLRIFYRQGRFDEAQHLATANLALVQATESFNAYYNCLVHLVTSAILLRQYDSAHAWVEQFESEPLVKNLDFVTFWAQYFRLMLAGYQAQWADVLLLLPQIQAAAEKLGNPEKFRTIHILMAWIEYRRSVFASAEHYARLAVDYGRAHDDLSSEDDLLESLAIHAIALSRLNRLEEAQALIREMLPAAQQRRDLQLQGKGLLAVAELLLAEANPLRAVAIGALIESEPRIGAPWQQDAARFLTHAQTMLDASQYSAAVETGQMLKLETVVQELLDEFATSEG